MSNERAQRILEGEDPKDVLEGGAATKMGRDAGRNLQSMGDEEIAQKLANNMKDMDQEEAYQMAQTLAQRLNSSDQNPVSNPHNTQEQDDDMDDEEPEEDEEEEDDDGDDDSE
jgi:hypothetical protein